MLVSYIGWMISDPICSMFIAALITMRLVNIDFITIMVYIGLLISVYPLMRDSLGVLMQRTPPSIDHTFSNALRKVFAINGYILTL